MPPSIRDPTLPALLLSFPVWFYSSFLVTVAEYRFIEMESSSKAEEDVGYRSITTKKAQVQSMLSILLEDDPIMVDVPKKLTIADVDTLINLELGSAMKIIVKMDNTSFDVVVLNSTTIKDWKLAIEKKINEMEQTVMGHRHISRRHLWANFGLTHQNEKLIDDNSVLSEYSGLELDRQVVESMKNDYKSIDILVHSLANGTKVPTNNESYIRSLDCLYAY